MSGAEVSTGGPGKAAVEHPVRRLDRGLQKRILETAADAYPSLIEAHRLGDWADWDTLGANLVYLHQHDLIQATYAVSLDGSFSFGSVTATAKGMDFLQDDGGLSAILGVVTVKFHDDTIRQLLLAKVDQSDADPTVKARLKEAIRSLPAEGLKTTLSLLEAGLDRLPDAVPLLQRWLGLGWRGAPSE